MNDHIRILLKSRDSEDRKQAIRLLAKIGDDEALRELALLFKNDPDAEVRDFAVKAGRYIKKTTQTMTMPAVKPTTKPATKPPKPTSSAAIRNTTTFNRLVVEPKSKPQPVIDDDDDVPGSSYHTSFADQERARGYVEAARVMLDQYKSKQAIINLRKAFEADPNLEYDSDFVRLAESATGSSGRAAIDALMPAPKAAEPETSGKRKPKPKRIEDDYLPGDGLRWRDVALDLGIFALVQAVLAFILCMIIANQVDRVIYSDQLATNASISSVGALLPLYFAIAKTIQIFIFLIVAVFTAVFSVVELLLHYASIHFAATVFLLGLGTFKRLIRALTIPYALAQIGIFIFLILPLILSPLSIGLVLGISCNFLAAWLILLVLYCLRLESVYDFGVIRGCMAFFLGRFVLGLITIGVNVLISKFVAVVVP